MTDFRRPLHDDATTPRLFALGAQPDARSCFDDEIAIDFPCIGAVVERMRDGLLGAEGAARAHNAAISLSRRDARDGVTVPLEVPVHATCARCGGRGETWAERCAGCDGSGECSRSQQFRLSVPAGVSDGTRFRFLIAPPHGLPTRIEVTVLVA